MMNRRNLSDLVSKFDMMPFELNVLDKRRTMCEKIVSLIRFSFTDNPIEGLASKIRHFYDLHFMCNDNECRAYLLDEFTNDLTELVAHDKAEYNRPPLWAAAEVTTSVLFTAFDEIWHKLAPKYRTELTQLTYGKLPSPEDVFATINPLMEYVKKILNTR